MLSTSIGVQFEVNDLNASYELLGTSDNYSFQYKLGKGSDLVDSLDDNIANEVVPLKGNYGVFEVRVFAVSDIGIRSEFVIGSVDVTPPTFGGTFTFSNLRISKLVGGVEDSLNIEYAPESPGDELIVSQQFLGNDIQLNWQLIPPVGHPREGQSVDTELLTDTFFSGFQLRIKNDDVIVSDNDLGNSVGLADSLLTNDVLGLMNNYRDFSVRLSPAVFQDLDLERSIALELVAVDKFGNTCTGTISGYNPPPALQNFSYSIRGSDMSFSWFIDDADYTRVDINKIAIPKERELETSGSLVDNVDFFSELNDVVDSNKIWDRSKDVFYESGDKVLWKDVVYEAVSNHTSSYNLNPQDGFPWRTLGERIDFEHNDYSVTETVFSTSQLWGYKYYYTFQAHDDFGAGELFLLSEDGELIEENYTDEDGLSAATLYPYESIVRIGNLSYVEDEDDFVFNWNVVDQDGNAVDLNQYKFAFKESSLPTMLGLSGSLYDTSTQDFLTGITEGSNGIGLNLDENGNTQIVGNLTTTKVFDTFRFTRELNNQIYGPQGFPANFEDFDDQKYYSAGDYVGVDKLLYQSIQGQESQTFDVVRPVYYEWDKGEDYNAQDIVEYDGSLYQANYQFGAAYSEGIFNFETIYTVGELVVFPIQGLRKFYDATITAQITSVDSSSEFSTDLTNIVDAYFENMSITINGETRTIIGYDGDSKTIALNQALSSAPQIGNQIQITGFSYSRGDIVFHNSRLYKSLASQSGDQIETPSASSTKWTIASAFGDVDCNIYKCENINNVYPIQENIFDSNTNSYIDTWTIQNPGNSDRFDVYVSGYDGIVEEWSNEQDFIEGTVVVYANDLWSGILDNGPNFDQGIVVPGDDFSVWTNASAGQDIIISSYAQGDLVYAYDNVYVAAQNNPVGAPIIAESNPGSTSLSSYQGTQWIPYWQRETIYDDLPYGHIGIPESGKRSVGIEIGIVDSNDETFSVERLSAYNQEPSILPQGFNVDSLSETTKVKFKFNYAFSTQEKTSKVHLYRSENPNFEITGSDGFPFNSLTEPGSTLVKVTLGAADATFGDNITEIFDTPPVPQIDGIDQITGYYYKILPFDDFGSGDLYGVNDNQGALEQCLVYPKNYSNKNPNGIPGPVFRTSSDDIPGPVVGFEGNTAFENYFLSWLHPSGEIQTTQSSYTFKDNIPNDLSHYEVWMSEDSTLQFDSINETLQNKNSTFPNNKGYRRIDADIESTGLIPTEQQDPAEGITNATRIFNVTVNGQEVETSYPGKTNDTRYFWVRPVDYAGNKGPFTGQSGLQGDTHDILGLGLTLGVASATDIEDFEINMTESFGETIALVPNNPFENNSDAAGKISWTQHYLFNEGTGFIVDASGAGTSDGYVWWDKQNENKTLNIDDYYVRWQNPSNQQISAPIKWGDLPSNNRDKIIEWSVIDPDNNQDQLNLRNVYFSGVNYRTSIDHPANRSDEFDLTDDQDQLIEQGDLADFNDGDFIVARNTNGIATPVYHAFANALIGTANIANAAIRTAHVHDLSADKIRAGTIDGHDIQITQQQNTEGAIRKAGFTEADIGAGVGGVYNQGFYLSGDGSFGFQGANGGSLSFDNGELVLRGNIKQVDNTDYDFLEIVAAPVNFNYVETDAGFEWEDANESSTIDITFRNSSVAAADDILVKAYGISAAGTEYSIGNISSAWRALGDVESAFDAQHTSSAEKFKYTPGSFNVSGGVARAKLTLTVEAFDSAINTSPGGESIVIYVKSYYSNVEKKINIGRIVDGAIGASVNIIFKRSSSKPAKPSTSSGVPSGWYDSDPGGTGLLWASNGVTSIGGGNFTWGDVFQVEGQAVAEVYAYRRNNSSGNSGGSYNFTTNILTPPNNWSINPPSVTAHSDKIYVIVGLATGSATDTSASISWLETPSVYAEKTDGQVGRSPTYQGEWESGKQYFGDAGTVTEPGRGDIVKYNNNYYICINTHTSSSSILPTNTTYWKPFGATFSSVATKLLITENSYVTDKIEIGDPDNNAGVIKSNGFVGGLLDASDVDPSNWAAPTTEDYSTAGFLLGYTSAGVYFDVGGKSSNGNLDSYMRFSSSDGRLKIHGGNIDGSLNINKNLGDVFDFTDYQNADPLATFIGGGYDNTITPPASPSYNSIASAIVAGGNNTVEGRFSIIGGGYNNICKDNFSVIAGGWGNSMPQAGSQNEGANFIGGGQNNEIDGGSYQSIAGGEYNSISHNGSIVYNPLTSLTNKFRLGDGSQDAIIASGSFYDTWLGYANISANNRQERLNGDSFRADGWAYIVSFLGSNNDTWAYLVFEDGSNSGSPYTNGQPAAVWIFIESIGWSWTNKEAADLNWIYNQTRGWLYFYPYPSTQVYRDNNNTTYTSLSNVV